MTILNIIKYPNKILKQVAKPIDTITEEIKLLGNNMLETMYANKGIGLAGNQIGVLLRIIVIDLQEDEDEAYNPIIFINPEIISSSDELAERDEGCLSLPKISSLVKRPAKIKISYLDINGEKKELEADNLLATCLQHEIDHLNGILFTDRISKLKRDIVLKKYKKLQEEAENINS